MFNFIDEMNNICSESDVYIGLNIYAKSGIKGQNIGVSSLCSHVVILEHAEDNRRFVVLTNVDKDDLFATIGNFEDCTVRSVYESESGSMFTYGNIKSLIDNNVITEDDEACIAIISYSTKNRPFVLNNEMVKVTGVKISNDVIVILSNVDDIDQ